MRDRHDSCPAVSVMLVDDHAVVRQGMRALFAMVPDIEVVGEAGDGRRAVDEMRRLAAQGRTPDVVLMDLVMPRLDGVTAIGLIHEEYPQVAVVALTSFSGSERVHAALEAGAAGYLLKDAGADEVVAAVRTAHADELHLDPAVARELTRSLRSGRDAASGLTAREREVLVLVARGLSNAAVAGELAITERTARTHVSNVLLKLGLSSRTQAALWAIREGLAPSPHEPEL